MESIIKRITSFFDKLVKLFFDDECEDIEEIDCIKEDVRPLMLTNNFEEEKILIKNRSLLSKLYSLEQMVAVLEKDFKEEYDSFMSKIDSLRQEYTKAYEESQKSLTFEIDPDYDINRGNEIYLLERKITEFIDVKLKFKILSEKLQSLIVKVNILYNTSIYYSGEMDKVISQLAHAKDSLISITHEFKNCKFVFNNKPSRERILDLISYADWLILKCYIRNSALEFAKLEEELILKSEFENFNYKSQFKDYISDELSDVKKLLVLVTIEGAYDALDKNIYDLQKKLAFNDAENIFNEEFLNEYLSLETRLINILLLSGVEKNEAKIGLIEKMAIKTKESEVITTPWAYASLCLAEIYQMTGSDNIILVLKLLSVLDSAITYKEIYFILTLFDSIDIVNISESSLKYKIEKYREKYPYEKDEILKKKDKVKQQENKEYLKTFLIKEYELDGTIQILDRLNFDYIVENNYIYLNSYYFGKLGNVLNALKNNA